MQVHRLPEFSPSHSLADVAIDMRTCVFSSQAQAAQHLPINRTTISRYERDRDDSGIVPPLGYLACLARLISEKEDQDIGLAQQLLLREMNKVRHRFYPDEWAFKDWKGLCEVADAYLAEAEHRRSERSEAAKHPSSGQSTSKENYAGRVNWPSPLTSFVGRTREREEIKRLLDTARLVTLTGAGGSGKTRLALEIGSELLPDYPDGVWLVELAAATDPELVPQLIATALGVREEPGQSLPAALAEYLCEKRLLLVLDNFEQVTEAAPLLTELLGASPGLKAIVTSRTPLHLRGEQEFPVPPLSLPNLKHLPPVSQLVQYEAVRLFVVRARDAKPNFDITAENALAVAEICNRLDGLPLAIELAAARVKILPPQAMLKRLQSRLKLLTGGPQDLPDRHKTLRDTIDWSYSLLDEGEKMLFRRMSVFVGGCTLEAAEAVCNEVAEPEPNLPLDVLDGLTALVDKSLLRQHETPRGEARFWMLETIHEYALECLSERGEEEALWRAHAATYLGLAEVAEPQLKGPEQEDALQRLESEHDNLRAAIDRSLQRGEIETAARLAGALWRFWLNHGYLSEGRRWLDKVITFGGLLPTPVFAKALHGAGVLTANQGRYDSARAIIEQVVAIYRELKDVQGIANALNSLGLIACHQDDPKAQAIFEESLVLQRALGDSHGVAVVLHNLGMIAEDQGDYIRAEPLYEESLALAQATGDKEGTAWALNGLGKVALDQEKYEVALSRYKESLALCQELGDKMGIALCLERLAGVAGAQRQPERAARLFGAAETLREMMDSHFEPSYRETYQQTVAAAREQSEAAAWKVAWAEGRAMPLEQALAYATKDAPEV